MVLPAPPIPYSRYCQHPHIGSSISRGKVPNLKNSLFLEHVAPPSRPPRPPVSTDHSVLPNGLKL